MTTPVAPIRRPLADLDHNQLRYAVVKGERVSRTSTIRRPRVVKPRWDWEDSSGHSNTSYAGVALRPTGRSSHGPAPSASPHSRKAVAIGGVADRIRRRIIAIACSPGGIIISTVSIFLSLSLAPIVSDSAMEPASKAPAQIAQMK